MDKELKAIVLLALRAFLVGLNRSAAKTSLSLAKDAYHKHASEVQEAIRKVEALK